MHLTETTVIKPANKALYRACDELCFLSKNLYNSALWLQIQNYKDGKPYINHFDMITQMRKDKDKYPALRALPSYVADYVIKQLHENFKSFFALCELKAAGKYQGKVRPPRFKDKIHGRNVTTFYKEAIYKKTYKREGLIHLSKTDIKFKSKIPLELIQEVKVVPKNGYYELQVVYHAEEAPKIENSNYAAIDLGINNLATVATNVSKPFIINGKSLKSINQRWNKRKAQLQSKLKKGAHTSKQIRTTTNKRNRRVKNYLHQASRALVNELHKLSISKVVIGSNKEWKKGINLGRRNNQNFVQIPHTRFVEMITYKAALAGIEVITKEESYTSKCSFLDDEPIEKHKEYAGRRTKRGIFKSRNGKLINADVNAAYNIMRKHLGIGIQSLDSVQVLSTPNVLVFGS